ncbi:hypothetical protein U1Q18_026363, partial [Sarracenia purpurea var. burkii]
AWMQSLEGYGRESLERITPRHVDSSVSRVLVRYSNYIRRRLRQLRSQVARPQNRIASN